MTLVASVRAMDSSGDLPPILGLQRNFGRADTSSDAASLIGRGSHLITLGAAVLTVCVDWRGLLDGSFH